MLQDRKSGDKESMKEGWHLDKKVPLSIIMALLVQTAVLIMWGTKLDSRVAIVEQSINSHTLTIETMKQTQNQISVGLARIEERQIISGEVVKEIRARLDERRK